MEQIRIIADVGIDPATAILPGNPASARARRESSPVLTPMELGVMVLASEIPLVQDGLR